MTAAYPCPRCQHRCIRDRDAATGEEWLCLVCGRRSPVGPFVPLTFVTRLGPVPYRGGRE